MIPLPSPKKPSPGHTIVVAVQVAKTFFRKSPTSVFGTSFLGAGDEEEVAVPLFRVAYIEVQLALIFSHGYQGWMPMLPSTDGAKSRSHHVICDNFICGNAFDVTDSHIMRMEKEDSGVKNMAEWWA